MPFPTNEQLVDRYYELCDRRDALYEEMEPLEEELTRVNAQIEARRIDAERIAKQIDQILVREKFIDLKKEIAQIASYLRRIPPRRARS